MINTTAYTEGLDAAYAEDEQEEFEEIDNPYEANFGSHEEWNRGYRDAKRDIENRNLGRP